MTVRELINGLMNLPPWCHDLLVLSEEEGQLVNVGPPFVMRGDFDPSVLVVALGKLSTSPTDLRSMADEHPHGPP